MGSFADLPDDVLRTIAMCVRNAPSDDDSYHMMDLGLLHFVNCSGRTFRLFPPSDPIWEHWWRDHIWRHAGCGSRNRKREVSLFGVTGCERCPRTHTRHIYYPWGIRVCKPCFKQVTVSRFELDFFGVPPEAYAGAPYLQNGKRDQYRVYMKRDIPLAPYGLSYGMHYAFYDDQSFAVVRYGEPYAADTIHRTPHPPNRCACPLSSRDSPFCMVHRPQASIYTKRFGQRRTLKPVYIPYTTYTASPGYASPSPPTSPRVPWLLASPGYAPTSPGG